MSAVETRSALKRKTEMQYTWLAPKTLHTSYTPRSPISEDVANGSNLFTKLPLVQVVKTLVRPTELVSNGVMMIEGTLFQGANLSINLDEETKTMLADTASNNSRALIRFAQFSTKPYQQDVYPPDLQIKINELSVAVGSDPQPIDITEFLNVAPDLKNEFFFQWTCESFEASCSWMVMIGFYKTMSVSLLHDQIAIEAKLERAVSLHHAYLRIYSSAEESVKLSMLCPLSKLIIKTPVKGISCCHIECCDLNSLLLSVVNSFKMTCPICKMEMNTDELVVDELFAALLRQASAKGVDYALLYEGFEKMIEGTSIEFENDEDDWDVARIQPLQIMHSNTS